MTDNLAGLSAEEKRVLLARLLMEKAEASASAHPLSYGQRSLWFLYQLAPGSPAYTITYAGQIRGALDVTALEAAAQALVDRHDILRTTYTTVMASRFSWSTPVCRFASTASSWTPKRRSGGCGGNPIAPSTCAPDLWCGTT